MAEDWGGVYFSVEASKIKPEYDDMVKAMQDQERKVKESELINDNNFIEASKRIYRWDTGQDFTGNKQDLVNYGLDKVSSIDFNTVDFATNMGKIYNAQKEDQIALLYLLDTVSDKDITWNGFKRGIKNVVSDPTLYLGFGAGKILGKAAQETAKEGVKLSLMKSIQAKIASETGTAATMGAGYTGVYDLGTQLVEKQAELRPNIDVGQLATSTAVGGAVGATIPKVISGIGQGIKKGVEQVGQWANEGEQLMMQQAGGGTPPIGYHYSPTDRAYLDAQEAKAAGLLGKTGGIETKRLGRVPASFLYRQGANVENDIGIGVAGNKEYQVDLTQFKIYDHTSATNNEKEAFINAQKPFLEQGMNRGDAADHALISLGYDGQANERIVEMYSKVPLQKTRDLTENVKYAGMQPRSQEIPPVSAGGQPTRPTGTIEATPSTTDPFYSLLTSRSDEERMAFEKEHIPLVNQLAKNYGLDTSIELSKGYFEGQLNPNMVISFNSFDYMGRSGFGTPPTAMKSPFKYQSLGGGQFDIGQKDKIENFLAEYGKATNQDAVAWYAPIFNGAETGANSYAKITENLSQDEWKQLNNLLANSGITPVMHNGRIDFMNFVDLPEDQAVNTIKSAITQLKSDKIESKLVQFETTGNYIGKEQYGNYSSESNSGRSDLQTGGSVWSFSDEIAKLRTKYSDRWGSNKNINDTQRGRDMEMGTPMGNRGKTQTGRSSEVENSYNADNKGGNQ